jgi:hypothetical protein
MMIRFGMAGELYRQDEKLSTAKFTDGRIWVIKTD